MNKTDERNYLLAAATWQETLMQSYRSLHVTIQSILLAVGVGLAVASLTIATYPSLSLSVIICAFILTCIAGLHLFSTHKFSGVIKARGKDINWWHKQIIRKDYDCDPNTRYFTKFKIHQQAGRKDVAHLEKIFVKSNETPSEEQIEELIGKGLGHTRHVIDQQLFVWIGRIWWLLIVAAWSGPVVSILKIYLNSKSA
jgi:hypothetical protein